MTAESGAALILGHRTKLGASSACVSTRGDVVGMTSGDVWGLGGETEVAMG
jgi:hypothetical protein